MTHQEIQANEIIEQYVRGKLTIAERRAFQEHLFECDECFQQAEFTARFVAGVREASRTGLLTAPQQPERARTVGTWFNQRWAFRWVTPALAASLLIAIALIGWWALSLRRQNRLLTQQTAEQNRAAEQLKLSETKIRELENRGIASQAEKEALEQEIRRLKEQVAAAERQRGDQLAQARPPDMNLPTINIYPVGDAQRSGGTSEVNQLRLPSGTRRFVLLLSDFQPGRANYQVEILNSSGRMITRLTGLKPDRNGEIRVTLNRSLLSQDKYTLKLLAQGKLIAEYVVQLA
jgi:putative zinc finger protein